MVHLRVADPIYRTSLWVFVTEDIGEYMEAVARHVGVEAIDPGVVSEGMYTRIESEGLIYDVMWLSSFDGGAESISVLVHELFHYLMDVMERKGITVSRRTEEAYTYFMQYLVRSIVDGLNKKNQKLATK